MKKLQLSKLLSIEVKIPMKDSKGRADDDEPVHDCRALNIVWLKVSRFCGNSQKLHRSREHKARDGNYSPRMSRSPSRSVSPKDEKGSKSRKRSHRHSRSISRSVSPRDEKNHRSHRRFPSPDRSPRKNGQTEYPPSRSQSPRENSISPARSPY